MECASHGRTTPALLSLYAIITLTAHELFKGIHHRPSQSLVGKIRPTFADAMALVRRHLWDHLHFQRHSRRPT